jgi:hypothetical protein
MMYLFVPALDSAELLKTVLLLPLACSCRSPGLGNMVLGVRGPGA